MPPLLQLLVVTIAVVMTGIAYDLAKRQGIDVAQVLPNVAKMLGGMAAACVFCVGGFLLIAAVVLSFLYPVIIP